MKYSVSTGLLVLSCLIVTALAGYSFIDAAWTAPPAGTPPANNVDAPLNIGTVDQIKDGGLGVDTLAVYGSSTFIGTPNISRTAPMIKFTDTDANSVDFWTHVNNNTFYILADRTNSGSWSGAPHPMRIVVDDNPQNDYVQFSNRVRASEYCDQSGNECISPSDLQDILAFSDIRSYTQTTNPQNIVSPGPSTDSECSCNSGDILTACNIGASNFMSGGPAKAKLNENGCYVNDNDAPQCTCLTITPAPGSVSCTVRFDYQFGFGPVTTKWIRYITSDPDNEWAVAMYADRDNWASPTSLTLKMSQLIVSSQWGGGDIALGIGGDAQSKGHGGVVNATTYRLGGGEGTIGGGYTYGTIDGWTNYEVDAFKFIEGETARVQVTDIFEGTAWISATVQDCDR